MSSSVAESLSLAADHAASRPSAYRTAYGGSGMAVRTSRACAWRCSPRLGSRFHRRDMAAWSRWSACLPRPWSGGHEVTLFCAPGSLSSARVVTVLDDPHPDEIERSLYEADHVARVFERIDQLPAIVPSTSCTTTAASLLSRWPTASTRRSCIPCTGSSPGDGRVLRPPRPSGARGDQPGTARNGARALAEWRDPEPDRHAGLAVARAQGRLRAVDRQDDGREGPAPRDRSGRAQACRSSWQESSTRPAGVLRPRGGATHRR